MPYYIRRKPKKKDRAQPLFDKVEVRVKKKTDYVRKLDNVFSLYIRLRDAMPNGMIRCISCGQIKPFNKFDNGHYFSRRKMATRWDEDNCHAECTCCNRFKADHLIGYRENLIRKIGQQRFDALTWKASQTKQWTDFELRGLIKYYKVLCDKLKKEKGL